MEDKKVPIGVWIFWSLVGLAIIIALFRWATGGNTPTYIAPIAACVSAMAATYAVYMTTKTFRQARLDRKEEIEARHPRFILDSAEVRIQTFDERRYPAMRLGLKNLREHAAKGLKVEVTVFLDPHNPLYTDNCEPTDYLEENGTFSFVLNPTAVVFSEEPYVLHLNLSYTDARTQKTHTQTLLREFRFVDGQSCELEPVYRSELNSLISKYPRWQITANDHEGQ